MSLRSLFLQHVAQTSGAPMAIEVERAEGVYIWDSSGKKYMDLIGGISVANTGHNHPFVKDSIRQQLDKYLHVMVYGEFIQSPQVQYAHLLAQHLPSHLNSVYFTNSGAEATEGAMKLAKRVTARTRIIAFENSYHGSTQGALSIIGNEYWRNAFRPLLPDVLHLRFNNEDDLRFIDESVACVVMETVQAESGITAPDGKWITELRKKCSENGVLLILDEIQAGFGRTGTLWAFEQFAIEPDILLLGKALGGGLPLGAFIASTELMNSFTANPVLGHISTFGGHPLSCAAGMASFQVLLKERLHEQVKTKEELVKKELQKAGFQFRSHGLWTGIQMDNFDQCKRTVDRLVEIGFITDWFLFAPNCLRLAPPLTISTSQLEEAINAILKYKV